MVGRNSGYAHVGNRRCRNSSGRGRLKLRAVLPGYGSHSAYAYQLLLKGEHDKMLLARKTSAFSTDPALKSDPEQYSHAVMTAAPEESLWQQGLDAVENFLPHGSLARKGLHRLRHMDEPVHFVDSKWQPAVKFEVKQGAALLETEVLIDDDKFDGCQLKLVYWPDAVNHLDLKMMPVANGKNFEWAKQDGLVSWVL